MKSPMMRAFAALLILVIAVAADAQIKVTAQLLDYEKGYVFFTTGDGFRVAPNAPILDYKTGAVSTASPGPRDWARATFDSTGLVTQLELSRTPLAPEGDLASVHRFAIALTPQVSNPDLAPSQGDSTRQVFSGKPVPVTFTLRVPPTTPLTANVYITTDQSAWEPASDPDGSHRRAALPDHALLQLGDALQVSLHARLALHPRARRERPLETAANAPGDRQRRTRRRRRRLRMGRYVGRRRATAAGLDPDAVQSGAVPQPAGAGLPTDDPPVASRPR